MTPTLWDHGFVLVLLCAIPVYGRFEYRRLVRRFTAGGEASREEMYRTTILIQWALVAALALLWLLQDRSLPALGMQVRMNAESALGAAVAAAGLAVLWAQRLVVRRLSPEGRERLRGQFEKTWALLPANDREHAWFRGLALTAGVCEELLYRGFLIPYAAFYAGGSAGVLLAAAAFGLGHYYQGARGVVKTFFVGVAAGALYRESGSLLWPMILHVALDLQGGAIGRSVAAGQPEPD